MSYLTLPVLSQLAINGLLLAGVYLLMAIGLNLVFGVMRVLNLAHGEILMLGGFTAFFAFALGHVNPVTSLLIAVPLFFVMGYGLYHVIVRPLIGAKRAVEDTSLIATYGLGLFLTSLARYLWSADYRSVPFMQGGLFVGDLVFSYSQLASFVAAITITVGLFMFLKKTRVGLQIRATAQNRDLSASCGVDSHQVYAVALGLGAACAAAAGTLLSMMFAIYPDMGLQYSIRAFVIVVLGGMGNMIGAVLGALILGLTETVGAFMLGAVMATAIPFILILVILWLRPQGLIGGDVRR